MFSDIPVSIMRPHTHQKMRIISGAKEKLRALAMWVGKWCGSLPALFWFIFFSSPFMSLCSFKFLSSVLEAGVSVGACSFVLSIWVVFELKGQGCEALGDVPCEKTLMCWMSYTSPFNFQNICLWWGPLYPLNRWGNWDSGRLRHKPSIQWQIWKRQFFYFLIFLLFFIVV